MVIGVSQYSSGIPATKVSIWPAQVAAVALGAPVAMVVMVVAVIASLMIFFKPVKDALAAPAVPAVGATYTAPYKFLVRSCMICPSTYFAKKRTNGQVVLSRLLLV